MARRKNKIIRNIFLVIGVLILVFVGRKFIIRSDSDNKKKGGYYFVD